MPSSPRQPTERSSLLPTPPPGKDLTIDSGTGAGSSATTTDAAHGPRQLWHRYRRRLDTHPVATKGITGMLILGAGDLAAQGVEHLRGGIDTAATGGGIDGPRALRFAAFGLLGAPWSHYYFQWLDHHLPPTNDRPCAPRTWLKVGIDQGLQAPLLLAVMIAVLGLLKGEDWRHVGEDLGANYWPTLVANWRLWIPFSVINLAFVQPELRVLFVNCVFFLWTIVLSMMLNSGAS